MGRLWEPDFQKLKVLPVKIQAEFSVPEQKETRTWFVLGLSGSFPAP